MSSEDASLQFPLHVSTEDEDFVIEKDGEDATSPHGPQFDEQGFLSSEDQIGGVRLKRRRRCGQCGPCQVKENCNKCHYCVRKDVLKQTCVYRKCVYLRSKPKPYARQPKEVIPLSQRPRINSPPTDVPRPTSQQVSTLFPDNNGLAKTLMPNNTVSSPPLPFPFGLPPGATVQTESKFKPPPSGMAPDLFSSISEHKSSNIPSSLPGPMNSHQTPLIPSLTNNSLTSPLSDFSSSFPRPSLHVPLPHSFRESSLMHYPGYGRAMVNEARSEVQSPCMYSPPTLRPPLSSSVSPMNMSPFDRNPVGGYLDRPPNRPTYLPNNSDLYRPFTSIPSASPGYPYSTQSRFSHNAAAYPSASSLPSYSGLGMHPSLHPSAMPSSGPHYGAFQTPSLSSNQSIGCPKNGQCPPASQTLDTQLMQERYGSTHNSKDNVSSEQKAKESKSDTTTDETEMAEQTRNIFNLEDRRRRSSSSSDCVDFLSRKDRYKLPPIPPAPLFCANLPWDMFNVYNWSRRPASVLSDDASHASVTSSDFECDIIGIDDLQINAMIRSDGCNSLAIEFDDHASETSGISAKSSNTTSSQNSEKECSTLKKKVYIQGSVHLKQDLGDEGIIQLELPGNKVTIEDSYLDSELAAYSSDVDGLMDFIQKEPELKCSD